MAPATSKIAFLATAAVAWSALVVVAAVSWPGPAAHPPYLPQPEYGIRPTALPPTDRSGSTMFFADDEDPFAAAVFWEIPEPGKVRITIELEAAEMPAGEPDAAGAGPETNGANPPGE